MLPASRERLHVCQLQSAKRNAFGTNAGPRDRFSRGRWCCAPRVRPSGISSSSCLHLRNSPAKLEKSKNGTVEFSRAGGEEMGPRPTPWSMVEGRGRDSSQRKESWPISCCVSKKRAAAHTSRSFRERRSDHFIPPVPNLLLSNETNHRAICAVQIAGP